MKKPPDWAVRAANRFVLPVALLRDDSSAVDAEELFKQLVRLQLAAYKRGEAATKGKRHG